MQRHYHLVGIGGIGMSGIARLLLASGQQVSGSDLKASPITDALQEAGAKIFIGHRAENIQEAGILIYSSAVKKDNPELQRAYSEGMVVLKRAEALASLMQGKSVITVAGSHGKTTVTSLVSHLLLQAGLCPTVVIGGILKNIATNACIGRGELFVAEADESDSSFLYYHPRYSIITNIDHEHLDYYGDFASEVKAFEEFIRKTAVNGRVFACADDPNLQAILSRYKNRQLSFGLSPSAGIYPKNIEMDRLSSVFDCFQAEKLVGRFNLALAGEHNISNSLAVIALGLELGIGIEKIKTALATYPGASRRLELKFSGRDCLLIDDYAHHPSEIKATLKALLNLHAKRIVAVFQPHRYSRTRLLLEEFALSFDLADYLIITDIYPAGESPIAAVSAQAIYEKIKLHSPEKKIYYLPKDELVGYLLGLIRPGDLVLTMGAGDIVGVADELAARLKVKGQV